MKVGTDFSGIGSPEQALNNLGIDYDPIFACEIDKFAKKSYLAIHKEPKTFYNDITKRNHSEVEQLDLYVAGFPCQSFSLAGKRQGFEDVRGTLFFNVAEFIKTNQPKSFILENVKGLASHDNGKTFQTIIALLSDNGGTVNGQISIPYFNDGLGYHIYYSIMNTKHHGIPQNRERIFIVGFREFRPFSFPKTEPLKIKLIDLLEDNVNKKYNINLKNFVSELSDDSIKVKSATKQGFEIAKHGDSINLEFPNSKTRRGRVGKQVSQTIKPTCEIGVLSGSDVVGCLLSTYNKENLKSLVKRGKNNNIVLNKKNMCIRKLTPLECWRLQNFPDEQFFKAKKVCSNTQLYKQAGNSITVAVIQKLIKSILL